jgi:DNA-binding transcriptional ArsR family regulator
VFHRSIFGGQADLCRCMASATRIEIVHVLRDSSQRAGDISKSNGQPQATVSRHLGALRNGGVVIVQRRARDTLYQVANPKIVLVCDLMREVLTEEAARRSRLVEASQDEHSR